MKKEYISPVAAVVELDSEALMYEATSTEKTNVSWSRKEDSSDAFSDDWEDWDEE